MSIIDPKLVGILLLGAIEVVLACYAFFAPTIIARCRQHRARDAILATNLLFGWTLIGWCVALIWALAQPRRFEIHSR
ncbi:superinfection immunity protein [Trinickia dinghuensis]|uniref:Superinfection immunity protein n=1 Tax=Trinickia dinghuensis TaxID=2291023 RepID=A0A3D8JSH7_9BURK|nr:superinfection immunity protein [Trinickia dinghuensis]RDU95685.1 superinfection immunity protein [Trinickia dinghuensis]